MSSYNISLIQGDSLSLTVQLKDSNGDAINLSGYNVRGKVKYSFGSEDYLLNLSPQISGDGSSGYITINVAPSGTASLPITVARYDLEKYTTNDGFVSNILNGKFIINPSVTI